MSRFKEEAEKIKENARYEPINILVWGPGDPGENASLDKRKAYEKRLKIKNHLREKFPRAEVFLSEDLKELVMERQEILKAQAIQAKIAHLILILDLGRGVDLEIDYFIPAYPWFREKAYVFLPERYVSKKGLVTEVLGKLEDSHIIGFSEQEFESCKLVTEMSVQLADIIAMDCRIRQLV
jgi:hypothetical protein